MKTHYLVPVGTITLTPVAAPVACIASLAGIGAGNVNNGNHVYKISFVTASGETELGLSSNTVTVVNNAVDGQVRLTGIPIGPAGTSVIQRRIYRNTIGAPTSYYFLATLADNTTTTYIDNTADAGLGANNTFRVNTTAWIYYKTLKAGLLSENNTFFGVGAGISTTSGTLNTFLGAYAGRLVTSSSGNTFVGYEAGQKITSSGALFCAFGDNALGNATGGGRVCAFGWWSLFNCTGTNNSAFGTATLSSNTSGQRNNAFGDSALYDNTTASYNNAFGVATLTNNTGAQNSAFGESALGFNTSGNSNCALGYASGLSNTTGIRNTYLGHSAGWGSTNNLTNTTCVGYNAQVTASNSVILGASANVGIGTTAPSTLLHLVGTNNSTVQTITINATTANIDASDTFVDFRSSEGSIGNISGTAVPGVIAYNTFTGSHYTQVIAQDRDKLQPNILLEIVEGNPEFVEQHDTIEQVYYDIEETEIDIIDTKEQSKEESKATNEQNKELSKVPKLTERLKSIGELHKIKQVKKTRKVDRIHKADNNEVQLFKTRICKTKGSDAAIGVYGGTDKEGRDFVLSIGTGLVYVANKGINVEIGNYLISSDIEGCSELQSDNIYRSSTIAKATEPITWKNDEEKRLIKCVYLGG